MQNYRINLITARRSYSIGEISSLLGVDRKTCGRWIKYGDLEIVEENTNPILVIGADLINFIKKKREKRRVTIKENEFYCMKCHKAVRAKIGSEQIIKTGKMIGKDNREQLKKIGVCENCNTPLNKFLGVCRQD